MLGRDDRCVSALVGDVVVLSSLSETKKQRKMMIPTMLLFAEAAVVFLLFSSLLSCFFNDKHSIASSNNPHFSILLTQIRVGNAALPVLPAKSRAETASY